ncbi:hypothetical protein V9T40_009595 [Parthenolecanium corni]|uniref:G-protein coupled receptors family 1 profile domain-containing protein n=1 Tax=Parthenolecanium corni TaxID=536013 RepID=A0AAN9TN13_9HEMI
MLQISEGWVLGPELCDMWTASDVLCCTASILHLVAIALDRYWAVTDVEYITRRSAWRIVAMIIIIWTVALVVSVAPQFGWKDPGYLDRINKEKRCLVSQDIGYQIFATCATFYVPLLAILVLYWKIFQAARRRIHKRNLRNPMYLANVKKGTASITRKRFNFFKKKPKIKADAETGATTNIALMDIPSSCSAAESSQENAKGNDCHDNNKLDHIGVERPLHFNSNDTVACPSTKIFIEASSMSTMITKQIQKVKSKRDKKQSLEAKREKKAAKTLAIITGAFVICWLPFFVMALAMPMCPGCQINRYVSSFFLWLGYFNSTLNPIIYTVFSPEFRQAFNRILCGIHNSGLRTR